MSHERIQTSIPEWFLSAMAQVAATSLGGVHLKYTLTNTSQEVESSPVARGK